MNIMRDKEPVNEQGEAHGEHLYYFDSGEFMGRFYYINGVQVGYSIFNWYLGPTDLEYHAQ